MTKIEYDGVLPETISINPRMNCDDEKVIWNPRQKWGKMAKRSILRGPLIATLRNQMIRWHAAMLGDNSKRDVTNCTIL